MMRFSVLFSVILAVILSGCGKSADGSGAKKFISIGSAPSGGTFFVIGGAFEKIINASDTNLNVTNESTKGSRENIVRLKKKGIDFGMSNAAITYFAVRGESGWDDKYEVRSVITMAPNVGQFVTTASTGIKSLADLKGKKVYVGPAGAGFDQFLTPILEAHGVKYSDFKPVNGKFSDAVGFLQDKQVDAAFLGGAIPTPAITQASATLDIKFIPFDKTAREELIKNFPFFSAVTVPAAKYKALDEDFEGLCVGYMHLITHADADEEMVYKVLKTIYENRAKVAEIHPAGKSINEKNAVRQTGTPFHPGAIKFYKEIGIWSE